MTLLLHLVEKVPFLSELEHDADVDLVRAIESDLGLNGIVAPKPGATNAPLEIPEVDPGPVAEPVPAAQQKAPTFGASVAPPEEANAFSGVTPA